jgi:hypothetical protein
LRATCHLAIRVSGEDRDPLRMSIMMNVWLCGNTVSALRRYGHVDAACRRSWRVRSRANGHRMSATRHRFQLNGISGIAMTDSVERGHANRRREGRDSTDPTDVSVRCQTDPTDVSVRCQVGALIHYRPRGDRRPGRARWRAPGRARRPPRRDRYPVGRARQAARRRWPTTTANRVPPPIAHTRAPADRAHASPAS